MSQQYHFDGPKYSTQGVAAAIPIETQIFMWQLIEELAKNTELDYLQVFALTWEASPGGVVQQKLTHSQECPPYSRDYVVPVNEAIHAKVFVIDDETHATMLLSHEY